MAAIIVGATALVASVVAVGLASEARGWLGFGFEGVPHTAGEALSIFAGNAKLAAAAGAAALISQLRWLPGVAGAAARHVLDGLHYVCAVALALAVLANVLVVGASFGAYGDRMIEAALPHGPIELAGFSVALSFYVQARRGPVTIRMWAWSGGATIALLTIAALLETFVPVAP